MTKTPFWKNKTFAEMTSEEWESLCDGCAKCCLHKLEDEDTGEVYYTDIACAYLNTETCTCKDYTKRLENVPECLKLRPEDIKEFHWLPSSCSYRLLAEGQDLPEWHHLISCSRETIHEQGLSVYGKVISETNVNEEDHEDRIIHWVT